MTAVPFATRPGATSGVLRLVLAFAAVFIAALLIVSTHHSESAPVGAAAGASVLADLPAGGGAFDTAGETSTAASSALTGIALGCAILGLCCLVALVRGLARLAPAQVGSIIATRAPLPLSSPSPQAAPSLQLLSISRT